MQTITEKTTNLFDNGYCILCSGSIVKHRVRDFEYAAHARKHIDQGDKVTISMPHEFKVTLAESPATTEPINKN